MLLAVPLGLGAAVYISEFCGGKTKETLKIVIELLAAIPSIVWGFIGYMVLGPVLIELTGAPVGINLLNGGIILALMSVPVIVSVGEDALKAVPDSYREAALSLGASRWEIVYRVLFPAAKNGLLAAVLLGVGRAIGETMAVLMATGHAVQIPHSLLDPIRTLTATIAAELGDVVAGGTHYRVLFVIGLVLFAVTFVVNLTADLVVKGIRSEQSPLNATAASARVQRCGACARDRGNGATVTRHWPTRSTLPRRSSAVGARTLPLPGTPAAPHLEIVCHPPGGVGAPAQRSRDISSSSTPGRPAAAATAAKSAPWWGSAGGRRRAVCSLHQAGELDLDVGQHLRLSHREVFTASSLENVEEDEGDDRQVRLHGDDAGAGRSGGGHPGLHSDQGLAGALAVVRAGEPAGLHDGRRHLGAAGRHVLPGVDLAAGGRAGRHSGRRVPERIRPRQLVHADRSTWRW